MTKYILTISSIPLMVLLAACGSSGGGGGSASFNAMAADGRDLFDKYADAEVTPVANMPANTQATYRGVAAYSDVPDPDYLMEYSEVVSEVELNANFSTGALGGELNNFRTLANERISGSVALRNGEIAGNEIYADLSGNLGYAGESLEVDGLLLGAFVGNNAQAVAGATAGYIGNEEFYGIFGAER